MLNVGKEGAMGRFRKHALLAAGIDPSIRPTRHLILLNQKVRDAIDLYLSHLLCCCYTGAVFNSYLLHLMPLTILEGQEPRGQERPRPIPMMCSILDSYFDTYYNS